MSSLSISIPTTATRAKTALKSKTTRQTSRKAVTAATPERELVLEATHHNHAAFACLYDRYVDKIYRYIYFKVGNQTDAEDMTAQVFMKAWQAIGNYQYTERPFAAWLYRIAHNLIVDGFRTRHETSSIDDMLEMEETGQTLEAIVEDRLTGETLRHALRHLTPDQRRVVVLRILEGYSTAEVAAIMGKAEGAVRTLQHRALLGLKNVFGQGLEKL